MEASNEEFRAFIIALYADYRAGGPTKSLTMLELLDKLDGEYNRINNLGRWVKREDPQVLALTATISTLQSQLSTLKGQYLQENLLIPKLLSSKVSLGSGVTNALMVLGIVPILQMST